jgi:hypothetical protein
MVKAARRMAKVFEVEGDVRNKIVCCGGKEGRQ